MSGRRKVSVAALVLGKHSHRVLGKLSHRVLGKHSHRALDRV